MAVCTRRFWLGAPHFNLNNSGNHIFRSAAVSVATYKLLNATVTYLNDMYIYMAITCITEEVRNHDFISEYYPLGKNFRTPVFVEKKSVFDLRVFALHDVIQERSCGISRKRICSCALRPWKCPEN
jgi:hypothetical protein